MKGQTIVSRESKNEWEHSRYGPLNKQLDEAERHVGDELEENHVDKNTFEAVELLGSIRLDS